MAAAEEKRLAHLPQIHFTQQRVPYDVFTPPACGSVKISKALELFFAQGRLRDDYNEFMNEERGRRMRRMQQGSGCLGLLTVHSMTSSGMLGSML